MKTASTLIVIAAIAISGAFLLGGPRNSAAAPSPGAGDSTAGASSLEQQIVSKEREGLDALKTGNLELFGNLTADDAVFVDAAGPATKAEVLKHVEGFRLAGYTMEDVRFVALSAKTGLITYTITEKGVSHGREFAAQAYISSIWTKRKNKWVCVFSQETTVRKHS
jgi:ketosteroid isomerase-like protein